MPDNDHDFTTGLSREAWLRMIEEGGLPGGCFDTPLRLKAESTFGEWRRNHELVLARSHRRTLHP